MEKQLIKSPKAYIDLMYLTRTITPGEFRDILLFQPNQNRLPDTALSQPDLILFEKNPFESKTEKQGHQSDEMVEKLIIKLSKDWVTNLRQAQSQVEQLKRQQKIKIFLTSSDYPVEKQAFATFKLAELFSGNAVNKILVIDADTRPHHLITQKFFTFKKDVPRSNSLNKPIYSIIQRADIKNLYFLLLSSLNEEDQPLTELEMKQYQELMQLFEIVFDFIFINLEKIEDFPIFNSSTALITRCFLTFTGHLPVELY